MGMCNYQGRRSATSSQKKQACAITTREKKKKIIRACVHCGLSSVENPFEKVVKIIMPKAGASKARGHGGKHVHATRAENDTTKHRLASRTSNRTSTTTKMVGGKPIATSPTSTEKTRNEGPQHHAGHHKGEFGMPATGDSSGGHENQQASGGPLQQDTALPSSSSRSATPPAATAGLKSQIASSKTGAKHGREDKHSRHRRRTIVSEHIEKSAIAATSPKSTVGAEVTKGVSATKTHPGGVPLKRTSGVKAHGSPPSPVSRVPSPDAVHAVLNVGAPAPGGLPVISADAVSSSECKALMPYTGNEAVEVISPFTSVKVSPLGSMSPIYAVSGERLTSVNVAASVQHQMGTVNDNRQHEDEPPRASAPSLHTPTAQYMLEQHTSKELSATPGTAIGSPGLSVGASPPGVPTAELDKDENRPPDAGAEKKKNTRVSSKPKEIMEDLLRLFKTPEAEAPSPDREFLAKKRRFSLTKVDIAIAFLGVSSILYFAYFLILVPRLRLKSHRLCLTEDCQHHAALLTKRVNWTLDPCEDFEAFVCSAWEPSKNRRDISSSVLDDLRFTWYDRFPDMLQKGLLKLSAGSKPLFMYDMCMNNYPKSESYATLIHSVLHQHGLSWPEPPKQPQPPLGLLVRFSYQWQWPLWITVNMLQPTSSGRRRLLVRQGLTLPIMLIHHRSVFQHYINYWKMFVSILYPNRATRPSVDETDVLEMRAMEAGAIRALTGLPKSSERKPAAISFNEIAVHVPNSSATKWVDDFQYGTLLQPNLTADDRILAHDITLLEAVGMLMAKYNKWQLNRHISWLIVQYVGIGADYALLIGYTGSKERAAHYLPIHCAFHVESAFKVLIPALAYFARFSERDHEAIDSGFDSLVLAAVERVNSSSWLDEESKLHGIKKLSSLKMSFWPSKSFLDDGEVTKLFADYPEKTPSFFHYWVKAHEAAARVNRTREYNEALMLPVNNSPYYASYEDFTNSVELAMGAATAPAFYSNGTRAMLYGGLLFLMAMQMVKAIDKIGIRLAYNGTVDKDIISAGMRNFINKIQCHHDGKAEDIFPEVPALEVAYTALTDSHFGGEDETLALTEHLTEEKVFFMTLCYLTCARPGYESVIVPDCNKIVRNSEAFARVYNCPKGAKMNPEKKCSFFT